ncbi:MAG TPA: outer membrane porin, OprD family, partial [Pseudomonas sp.]|nr:outer membrane porin, OprD family [Pseudomonas sp.]
MHNNKNIIKTLLTLSPCLATGTATAAGFIEDSKASLQTSNYY